MNIMEVDAHRAKIAYDPDIDMFRGEILGLNGGADFYGTNPEELKREFKKSLQIFLQECQERGIPPYKEYSGRFNLTIPPKLHQEIATRANVEQKSINQWLTDTLQEIIQQQHN
ncbi:type II toxin-antitoxin system HicB family antitoxin [Ectothiorhodospiraceae bacterium BW-2]|nr:type II toxin-antitoxin system HicB family antitoxin [Ectothiorhodospiraceae bacterium BW-2]